MERGAGAGPGWAGGIWAQVELAGTRAGGGTSWEPGQVSAVSSAAPVSDQSTPLC